MTFRNPPLKTGNVFTLFTSAKRPLQITEKRRTSSVSPKVIKSRLGLKEFCCRSPVWQIRFISFPPLRCINVFCDSVRSELTLVRFNLQIVDNGTVLLRSSLMPKYQFQVQKDVAFKSWMEKWSSYLPEQRSLSTNFQWSLLSFYLSVDIQRWDSYKSLKTMVKSSWVIPKLVVVVYGNGRLWELSIKELKRHF